MAEILDEVVPSDGGSRAESRAAVAPAAPAPAANRLPARGVAARRGAAARPVGRPAVVRRRYSEYGTEYQYVWNDLHRILIVAGILIALLIVLSFVLNQ